MIVTRALLGLATLLAAGCGTYKPALDADGMYRFASAPFAVRAPVECMPGISVQGSGSKVTFTTGPGDWVVDGEFSVEVHGVPAGAVDRDFPARAREIVIGGMELAAGTQMQSEKFFSVNGKPAYQAVVSDEVESVLVATHVRFPEHVVVVHFGYPLEDARGQPRELPWECHDRLLGSIVYAGER